MHVDALKPLLRQIGAKPGSHIGGSGKHALDAKGTAEAAGTSANTPNTTNTNATNARSISQA